MTEEQDRGITHPPAPESEKDVDQHLKAAREGEPYLKSVSLATLAEYVNRRWHRLDKRAKNTLAELKVNYMRFKGDQTARVSRREKDRVFSARKLKRRIPTMNVMQRTIHAYVAQIVSDDPVMQAVPVSHDDEDRDAAEAASEALRGEWQRLKLRHRLQSSVLRSAIYRSVFWFFQWDDEAGGKEVARKFFLDERGERVLLPVGSDGEPVEDIEQAAKLKKGHICVSDKNPASVRWEGMCYAHEAPELMVGEVMKLSQLYEMHPESRKVKIEHLLPVYNSATRDMSEWVSSMELAPVSRQKYSGEAASLTGEQLPDGDSVLDEMVHVIHYFRRPGRTYGEGFHGIVCGRYVLFRGDLRYGLVPVVQLRCLDEPGDAMGVSMVDILRNGQEIMDRMDTQTLRIVQAAARRRYILPSGVDVDGRDFSSPTTSVIRAPDGVKPTVENPIDIPNSLHQNAARLDRKFEDLSGLHPTLRGKHEPGVTSGRHAEALRLGGQTLLSLTAKELQEALEYVGKVKLAMIKKEWSTERRVRYFGSDREYVDKAFMATDFGETEDVMLSPDSLRMLTPAQKMERILSMYEAGVIDSERVRHLLPNADDSGISTPEQPHYMRARRQNARFLKGPPRELIEAREVYDAVTEQLRTEVNDLQAAGAIGALRDISLNVAVQRIQQRTAQVEAEWSEMLDKYSFSHGVWEDDPDIAKIHAHEHARALGRAKVRRFPEWWQDLFAQHARLEYELGNPDKIAAQIQVQQLKAQAAAEQLALQQQMQPQPEGQPPPQ